MSDLQKHSPTDKPKLPDQVRAVIRIQLVVVDRDVVHLLKAMLLNHKIRWATSFLQQ